MAYLVGAGFDVALEDLDAIDPQPSTVGLQYARRSFAISGVVIDEAPYVEMLFSALEDAEMYQSLLTQFGLTSATTAPVSVYLQDETYAWILRNGVAVRPFVGSDIARKDYFIRDVTLVIKSLRPQA